MHKKNFFLMKRNVFCNAEDRFSSVFCRKSHFKSLLHKITSFGDFQVFSLKTPMLCLVQMMRLRGHRVLKNVCFSEKKLLHAILRAKLKNMKNASF